MKVPNSTSETYILARSRDRRHVADRARGLANSTERGLNFSEGEGFSLSFESSHLSCQFMRPNPQREARFSTRTRYTTHLPVIDTQYALVPRSRRHVVGIRCRTGGCDGFLHSGAVGCLSRD